MTGTRRTRVPRPWRSHLRRALGTEHNDLAREVDRSRSRSLVLGAAAIGLAAVFGAGAARADLDSAERHAAAAAPHLHRVEATLLTPPRSTAGTADPTTDRYRSTAAWTYPSGQHRSGTVALAGPARSGSTTGIWVDDAGQPTTAPRSTADLVSDAVCAGLFVFGALSVLTACGVGLRLTGLNRRADAAWQRTWAELEPVWTGRASRRPGNGDARHG